MKAEFFPDNQVIHCRRHSSLWCCHSHSSLRDHQDPVIAVSNPKERARLIQEAYSLQLQGELQAKKDAPRLYKGVFHGVRVILKNEGPKGLYRGIGAAVMLCVDYISWLKTDSVPSMCTRWSSMAAA